MAVSQLTLGAVLFYLPKQYQQISVKAFFGYCVTEDKKL